MNIINKKQPEGGLLQSEEWANVLRTENKEILNIKNNIHCIINKLPVVGKYMYIPRVCNFDEELIDKSFNEAKSNSCGWLRIDVCDKSLLDLFNAKNIQYAKVLHDMQPKENLIIDIKLLEEELLAGMKSKTRYNIKLAEKKGVSVFTARNKKYIDIFYDLVEQTAKRKGVKFHNKEHYEKIFDNMPEEMVQLYVAKYNETVIAINIISFYRGVATYLHGATSDKYKNVMAPFLLQWQAIKDAKNKNCDWYDFGGVFPSSNDTGKKGITRFKTGFSPKTQAFKTLGSYDVILSKVKYRIYRVLQKIKNK